MSIIAERLILVDEKDRPIGNESKEKCHQGEGLLHRAFSVFILNSKNELLLQQRSQFKPLWPLSWSNTCCSHPRLDESTQSAATRRLTEEVGMHASLRYLYKFTYAAKYDDQGSEREVCHVFIGHSDDSPVINFDEIADYRWVQIEQLQKEVEQNPENFTPWFRMELKEIITNFPQTLQSA
ncbi:MAG: isopentenyl-diphosphate Delta-isomerase [Leptospirales bacterium]